MPVPAFAGWPVAAPASEPAISRALPATGERIPAVGLGTWITFNVGDDPALRASRIEVMRAFFEMGGSVIDSSPMYGSSEAVIGDGLARLGTPETLFAATKVWTWRQGAGPDQMAESRRLWGCSASTPCRSTTSSAGKAISRRCWRTRRRDGCG